MEFVGSDWRKVIELGAWSGGGVERRPPAARTFARRAGGVLGDCGKKGGAHESASSVPWLRPFIALYMQALVHNLYPKADETLRGQGTTVFSLLQLRFASVLLTFLELFPEESTDGFLLCSLTMSSFS
eukprot:3157761-Amphidinium_carterae.1